MRRGGNGKLLRHPCPIADTNLRADYRKKLLTPAMTNELICYFVLGTRISRHGDGVEDA